MPLTDFDVPQVWVKCGQNAGPDTGPDTLKLHFDDTGFTKPMPGAEDI